MIWLILISLFLPAVWLAAHLLDGWQRSKYIASIFYLFISWMMIVATFAVFIDVWKNQVPVRAFLSEEMARYPLWVRTSYDLFDGFFQLFSAGDLLQGAIYSLPALVIPLVRLGHFRRKDGDTWAFQYAAFNMAYAGLAEITTVHGFGAEQVVATYVRLGSYLILLLAHWFLRPTAVAKTYPSEKPDLIPKMDNG
jgi:hypothetical protein